MSSKTSFCNSNNNKEDNIVSLLPECFLSHHPSRRVIHYSSKQIPSIMNNCYDSKLMNKSIRSLAFLPKNSFIQRKQIA